MFKALCKPCITQCVNTRNPPGPIAKNGFLGQNPRGPFWAIGVVSRPYGAPLWPFRTRKMARRAAERPLEIDLMVSNRRYRRGLQTGHWRNPGSYSKKTDFQAKIRPRDRKTARRAATYRKTKVVHSYVFGPRFLMSSYHYLFKNISHDGSIL